jgi:NADH-quinone oxidoreductase subunit J
MIAQSIFAAFAAVLVVSSLLVILHRNPVASALFLVSAFCALAGIYLTLHAEFLGMVQVIVYAGAIMVLFLFVIMYLNLKNDLESGAQHAVRRGLGWIAGGVLLAEAILFVARRWAVGPIAAPVALPPGNTQAIGVLLYSRYLFPFEITSMVLLVAIVGAIMISKPRRTRSHEVPVNAPHAAQLEAMHASPQAQAGASKTSPPTGPYGPAQHDVEVPS